MSTKKKMVPGLPDELTTPETAADYLKLSPKTLANMRCRGDGPPYVKYGRIRYRWGDLDAFIERRIRSSTSENDKTGGNSRG